VNPVVSAMLSHWRWLYSSSH